MPEPTTLLYLTENRFKFHVAQQALRDTNFVLEQNRLPVPEIQSNSVQEIAEFSAQWAGRQIDQRFIVTDSGFFIDALNGFPGPFIKYINQWFTVEDLLRLLHNKPYRHINVYDCLVYSYPGQAPVSFNGRYQGKLATTPGQSSGTPIERLFVPDGYTMPISEFSNEERVSYWSNAEIWRQFKQHYEANA
jgi:XTP/dITP diphosphohydrolase